MAADYRPPAFQFYVKDWLTSKRVLIMPNEAISGYLFLLCEQWDTPDCTLPNDDQILSKLSRLGHKWLKYKDLIMPCFVANDRKKCGRIFNRKLRTQFLELKKLSRIRREAGISSGKSRRKATNKTRTPDEQNANNPHNKTEHVLNSSSSILKKEKEKEKINKKEKEKGARTPVSEKPPMHADARSVAIQPHDTTHAFSSAAQVIQSLRERHVLAQADQGGQS